MALPLRRESPDLTAEELIRHPELEPCELVRGKVVPMAPTGFLHGDIESERVDLEARRLEVRSQPQPDGEYAVTRVLGPGDRVEVPGTALSLEVAALVP